MSDLSEPFLPHHVMDGWTEVSELPSDVNDFAKARDHEIGDCGFEIEVLLLWEQRLTPKHLFFLVRSFFVRPIVLYARQRQRWWFRTGTLKDLHHALGLDFFHSCDRGLFTVAFRSTFRGSSNECLLDVPPRPVVVREEKMEFFPVYLVSKGPTPFDVIAYRGLGETVTDVIFDGGISWQLCSRPQSKQEINVPLSVRSVWLRNHYATKDPVKLKDSSYYTANMEDYTLWSYPIHAAQLSQICEGIPKETTIVAPGDGVGLVPRVWTGKSMSGDRVLSSFSHASVVQEDIWETIQRGRAEENALFLFSYLTPFLSSDVLLFIEHTTAPILVLENKRESDIQGLTRYGVGLFGKNIPSTWILQQHYLERQSKERGIQYSENLLRKVNLAYYSNNTYVRYFFSMRPLASGCCLSPSFIDDRPGSIAIPYVDGVPIVASTVKEYLRARAEYPYGSWYFGPTGNDPGPPIFSPSVGVRHVLKKRTLYYCTEDSPYISSIKSVCWHEYVEYKGEMVFFFYYPFDTDRDFVLDQESMDSRGHFTLSFRLNSSYPATLCTILMPFVFVRHEGLAYDLKCVPGSESTEVCSILSHLPCSSALATVVGRSFACLDKSWWKLIFARLLEIEESSSADPPDRVWHRYLVTWIYRQVESSIVTPPVVTILEDGAVLGYSETVLPSVDEAEV